METRWTNNATRIGGLSGLLLVLGAMNRFRSVPFPGTRPQLLRRLGGSELAVVAVVLIATAALLNLALSVNVPGHYSFDVRATTAQGETIHGIFTGMVAS
jgi:hypothetical protein